MMRNWIASFGAMLAMLAFALPAPALASMAPARQVSDFDCAVSYWLHGAVQVAEQQAALERASLAFGQYLFVEEAIFYDVDDPAVVERWELVVAEGKARGQRIQQGQETVDNLKSDLAVCEARYGFAQSGEQ